MDAKVSVSVRYVLFFVLLLFVLLAIVTPLK